MGILSSAFRETIEKQNLGGVMPTAFSHLSGFDIVDYANGGIDPETGELHVGFREGRIATFIGKSGVGKSTLADQIGFNIVKPFENGVVNIIDTEKSNSLPRLKTLYTGGDNELFAKFNEQVVFNNRATYVENTISMLSEMANLKLKLKNELMVEVVDVNGKKQKIMPPSVFIIDSWAAHLPKGKIDNMVVEGEAHGNMDGAQGARANNAFLKSFLNPILECNIHIFIVNHLTQIISTNQFNKKTSQLNFLKEDETMPGGTSAYYLADFFAKLEAGAKLTPDSDYGIKGFNTHMTICKSRGNEAGLVYPMIMEQRNGYCPILSNIEFLRQNKRIQGGGRASFLESAPNDKFTLKTVREVFAKSETFREALGAEVDKIFMSRLPQVDPNQNNVKTDFDENV